MNTTLVGLNKLASWLAGKNTSRELSHRVHVLRERLNQLLLFGGELSASEHILLEVLDLRVSRVFSGQKEPKHTLRDRLTSWNSLGSILSDLEEVVASVLNTVDRVQFGCLIEHAWQTSHSSDDSTDSDVSNLGGSELLVEFFDLNLSDSNFLFHLLL
jgi:hypothetical protein